MKAVELHIPDDNESMQFASLTIQREASLNALDKEVLIELGESIRALEDLRSSRPQLLGAAIYGSGEKAFVAGADIRFMRTASNSELESFSASANSTFTAIEDNPLIIAAVVDGFALGGGMELALACDLVFATNSAVFGQPEVNLGLIPGFGGTQRLCQRVGIGQAKRLIFSGESIDASRSFELGISDYLVDDVDAAKSAFAKLLSTKSACSLSAAKMTIDSYYKENRTKGLELEQKEFLKLFETEDAKEGLTAFVEKRKPIFKGK